MNLAIPVTEQLKYTKGIYYRRLEVEEWDVAADTFNANCVLIPKKGI